MDLPDKEDRAFVRAVLIVALTAPLLFGAWCLLDVVYVRVPSGREVIRATEVVVVGLTCVAVFLAHWKLHRGDTRVVAAIITGLLAVGLAVLLILCLGIPFHLWIGGGL